MESFEMEQQELKINDLEETLHILRADEGDQQSLEGNDLEETTSSVHGEYCDLQSSKENYAEETLNTLHYEDDDQKSTQGNHAEENTTLTPHLGYEDSRIPTVGLKFFSEHEAYDFYNAYAARTGFSIRRGGIRHNTKGFVRQRNFVCSKEGLKVDYGSGGVEKGNKLETRTDCKASIRFTVTGGVWEVTRFNSGHNHELAEPEQRKYLRSTRRLFEASPITSMVSAETVCHTQIEIGVIRIPSIGMKAYSEDEAYNLYNVYATQIGFSIRKGGYRHNSRGQLRQRNYVCSKQGLRVDDEPYRVKKVNRLETRTDCKASTRFTITDGVWEITYFNPDHNHSLVGPEHRKYLRSSRRISQDNVGLITFVNNDNMRQMKTNSCLSDEIGGTNNVGFPILDEHDLLHTQRTHIIEGEDGQNIIDHFKHKQAEDAMFFYSVQVDDNNRMMNYFWRDGRSRIDYDCFGDVIVFDTSFRTNKYNLICTPFVGINHHGKDVLFGCAIMSDESLPSFTWLFETFLESMGNQQPKTIFTNQCQQMTCAVEEVFSRAHYRLNVSHIQDCARKQLPNLYANPEFKKKFTHCLYGCYTETEFQSSWGELIEVFCLAENGWLKAIYDLRGKWCRTFSQDTFSANMKFFRGSDSNKNVFDHMSCITMNLTQFVHQYEDTKERMRLTELEDDVRCNQGVPTRASRNSGMLKQAADVYTSEIFKLFQEEMVESLSIVMNERNIDGKLHIYDLTEEGHKEGHSVHFDSDNCTTACSCKMFESTGLLCRHALRVLNMKNVTKIPAQYILKRWTKSAKKGASFPAHDESSCSKVNSSQSLLRSRLMYKAFCAVDKSLMTRKGPEIADAFLDQIIEQAEKLLVTSNALDTENGDVHNVPITDTSDGQCALESSLLNTSHAKQKSHSKKRKGKASKSDLPGPEKQQIVVGPSTLLFHPPQLPTFFRPAFHPSIIGMNASPYPLPTFHQGHFPTWVLGNFRPASPIQKTDQMPHTSQDSSTSINANHTHTPQHDKGNGSSES